MNKNLKLQMVIRLLKYQGNMNFVELHSGKRGGIAFCYGQRCERCVEEVFCETYFQRKPPFLTTNEVKLIKTEYPEYFI